MDPLPSINNVYSLVVHEESNNVMFLASISLIEYNIFINASNARRISIVAKVSMTIFVSSLTSFTSFYKIKLIHVNLPNGSSVLVQHAGAISLSPNLFLTMCYILHISNLTLFQFLNSVNLCLVLF
ncbi:transmembrane protein, putative [Medicago truncatula]|uniref:Transmembrane protein, putative n=1 Tax=Medicago truncatula TaxID=3880 RepID=A0A072VKG6_MEDTR|nr:transmembrane protein, putative [Medicago truncatula]